MPTQPHLSAAQRQALARCPGAPLYVVDAQTQAIYLLLSVPQFETIRPLLEDEPFNVRETYAAQDQVAKAAGWDDPALDVYGDEDTHSRLR